MARKKSQPKVPPGYVDSCKHCRVAVYETGTACDDHAPDDGAVAALDALDAARLQMTALFLDATRIGTVQGREDGLRILGVMATSGEDLEVVQTLERLLASARREVKPAGDVWGETGRRMLELMKGD